MVKPDSSRSRSTTDRRAFVIKSTATAVGLLTGLAPTANAVLSAGKCTSGVGDGCDELAGDNDYIKQLQAKSAANREVHEREALNAYI